MKSKQSSMAQREGTHMKFSALLQNNLLSSEELTAKVPGPFEACFQRVLHSSEQLAVLQCINCAYSYGIMSLYLCELFNRKYRCSALSKGIHNEIDAKWNV